MTHRRSVSRSVALVVAVLTGAVLLSGCCPGGKAVLSSMTLLPEEQAGCTLVNPDEIVSVPIAPLAENPFITSMSSKGNLLASEVAGVPMDGVKNGYVAVYECEPGGPRVRVYAVLFKRPMTPERAAAFVDAGGTAKGQLAGMIVPDDDVCEECLERVTASAERVLK